MYLLSNIAILGIYVYVRFQGVSLSKLVWATKHSEVPILSWSHEGNYTLGYVYQVKIQPFRNVNQNFHPTVSENKFQAFNPPLLFLFAVRSPGGPGPQVWMTHTNLAQSSQGIYSPKQDASRHQD